MSDHEHESFIKTPKQLITLVILAFVVPIFLIILLATYSTNSTKEADQSSVYTAQAIAERLAPVAQVAITTATTNTGGKPNGKELYESACMACHSSGAAGAPKFGDKAAWAPRVKEGLNSLTAQAIKGIRGMPPRGGTSASDEEIKAAVAYMLDAVK